MYRIKAFFTDGVAESGTHENIMLAWPAFSHTVQSGLAKSNLVRCELWDISADNLYDNLRAVKCPLAVFDLALIEEKFAASFRQIELTRKANEKEV